MEIANLITTIMSSAAAVLAVFVALYVNYESKLPDVVAYLEHDRDHSCLSIVIRNLGNGVARNVCIGGFDYSMADSNVAALLKQSFLEKGIPMLVPDASRSTIIQFGGSMHNHMEDSCVITISYEERAFPLGTKRATKEYVLDYYSFANSSYVLSDVHEIRNELVKMTKAIEQISKR